MKRDPSPALRLGSAAALLVLTTLFSATGCGAGAMGSKAYSEAQPPSEASLQTNVMETEALLVRAEYDIDRALGRDKRGEAGRAFAEPPQAGAYAQQPAATGTTASEDAYRPPPPTTPNAQKPKDAEAKAEAMAPSPAQAAPGGADAASSSATPCVTACRALGSMERAANHICELAGDGDSRCTNARERVRVATERVRQNCSDCNN